MASLIFIGLLLIIGKLLLTNFLNSVLSKLSGEIDLLDSSILT